MYHSETVELKFSEILWDVSKLRKFEFYEISYWNVLFENSFGFHQQNWLPMI